MSQVCCLQNGSLDDALHSRRPKQAAAPMRLDWAARITIAAEVASALMHLHSLQPIGVMHGGLQPSCILLDGDFSSSAGGCCHWCCLWTLAGAALVSICQKIPNTHVPSLRAQRGCS